MAVKEILLIGNPLLREKSENIIAFDARLKKLVQDLKDTLIDLQQRKSTGRAIAAPQIGTLEKVIYIHLPHRSFALINPEITWRNHEIFEVWDSCFSFDVAFFVKIERHQSVKVKFYDEEGNKYEEIFKDDLSELLQHEIDHLYGILATDHLKNNQDIMMREEWEKRYNI